jgi:hypothetical protein
MMTSAKLLTAAAVVCSIVFAMPAIAQQAVQEPGEQAFYESLGVKPAAATSSMASWGNTDVRMAVPTKRHRSAWAKMSTKR